MSDDIFQSTNLDSRTARRTYLVTYSQADLQKYPSRQIFGESVAQALNAGESKHKVICWACCLEPHQDGGQHYHVSIKLSGPKRWKSVKDKFADEKNVQLHFSDHHTNYYSAYKYVSKSDKELVHSPNHPNLTEVSSPRTKKCVDALRRKRKSTSRVPCESEEPLNEKPAKLARLTNLEVSEFIVNNNIEDVDGLYAVAKTRKNEGDKSLANFLFSRNPKSISDLFESTRRMETANEKVDRAKMNRMDLLNKSLNGDCNCNGLWFRFATEVLTSNGHHPFVFADHVRKNLVQGRGKSRNIILVGPASCGKTFLLKPIEYIFNTFVNPTKDKYAWVGADQAEAIFLNDFRWSAELIQWDDLLRLLEGHTVHLPAPKNHFSSDVCITKDTPVFATSKQPITFLNRQNCTDPMENEMMATRWDVFEFHKKIPLEKQRDLEPCAKCFAKLVKLGE